MNDAATEFAIDGAGPIGAMLFKRAARQAEVFSRLPCPHEAPSNGLFDVDAPLLTLRMALRNARRGP